MIYQTFDDLSKKEQDAVLSSMTILVDTREHEGKNDHILSYFDKREIPWKRQKLDQGDYSCMIPANEGLGISEDLYFDREVMIERKANLNEISGRGADLRRSYGMPQSGRSSSSRIPPTAIW